MKAKSDCEDLPDKNQKPDFTLLEKNSILKNQWAELPSFFSSFRWPVAICKQIC